MNVLITGAQFTNKGAQSLLFSVMDQLRRHYGEVEIYYLPMDGWKAYAPGEYRFHLVYDDQSWQDMTDILRKCKRGAEIFSEKLIRGRVMEASDVALLHQLWPKLDAMIDVSGYQLSSKWNWVANHRFLRYIQTAQAHQVPVILMPQSFGPFDYGARQQEMDRAIGATLQKASLIFARERDGYELLRSRYGLEHVELSPDLVLQSGELDWHHICYQEPELDYPHLSTTHNVGIVPNFQTLEHGDRQTTMDIYKRVITHLTEQGKEVYIFRHSEDLAMCKEIYRMFEGEARVHLLPDAISCLAYGAFVRQFDYVIASRFHAIVHAYREAVPALILGWAVKYQELAARFEQQQYVFDITNTRVNQTEQLLQAVDRMEQEYSAEREKIRKNLKRVQCNTCFDQCWTVLDRQEAEP